MTDCCPIGEMPIGGRCKIEDVPHEFLILQKQPDGVFVGFDLANGPQVAKIEFDTLVTPTWFPVVSDYDEEEKIGVENES